MTTDELKTLQLGYLTGSDLLQYCPAPLLISQFNQDNSSLQQGCNQAYAEAISKLITKYDVTDELKTVRGDVREQNLVGIVSVLAVRKILGSIQNISEVMQNHFRWADACIKDIRNAQMNLMLEQPVIPQVTSTASLVKNNFSTLG